MLQPVGVKVTQQCAEKLPLIRVEVFTRSGHVIDEASPFEVECEANVVHRTEAQELIEASLTDELVLRSAALAVDPASSGSLAVGKEPPVPLWALLEGERFEYVFPQIPGLLSFKDGPDPGAVEGEKDEARGL